MKKIIAGLTMITALLVASPLHAASDDFVGVIKAQQLHKDFSSFQDEFDDYEVRKEDIALIKSIKEPIQIKALFGTWCHDSVREIPRLNKLLALANNQNITNTLIAVDRKKTADDIYRLKYTPTIIIYQNNQEVGRIIESPKQTIAKDIIEILASRTID